MHYREEVFVIKTIDFHDNRQNIFMPASDDVIIYII